jgi:peptidoglycan LD-endopeptidase CwlK
MSLPLFKSDVLFYQRFLKANGFYHKGLDGDWGPGTDAADKAFEQEGKRIADQFGRFDQRTENCILSLVPKVQATARRFLFMVRSSGVDARILSGTRTYAEQDHLYRKGRGANTEPKVTNAKGGQSNHNFGIAWDIGLFENGQYVTDETKYAPIAHMVLPDFPELEWGGNWKSLKDVPHYQYKTISNNLATVRAEFEAGMAYV